MKWLTLIGLLLAASCSSPSGSGALPAEELRRKLLDHQAVRFPQRQFVVGLGAGPSLAAATTSAFGEITRQLTWLPAGAQDLLVGLYRIERSASDSAGQVQALASLERDGAAAHLRRLARQAEQAAADRLPGCQRLLAAGEIEQTETCLAAGKADLLRAGNLLAAGRAAVGDQARRAPLAGEAEYQQLEQQASAGRTSRGAVLLHVIKEVDGKPDGDLDESFGPVVTGSGLKRADGDLSLELVKKALAGRAGGVLAAARQGGAGYLLVGRVRGRFVAEESGQYFAMADGAVRLLEAAGGRVVAELSCRDVKGGHISREQAVEKAVSQAAQQLLRALQGKLKTLAGR